MQNEKIAMIGGIDENTEKSKSKIGYLFGTKSYKLRAVGHVTKSVLGRYPNDVVGEVETQWAMGYFFAIKKSLKDEWNIDWDEKLISYGYPEDLDFSFSYYKKADELGLSCILSDKVKVRHLVSKEYRTASYKSTVMYVINREYLSYKHKMGLFSLIANRWANFGEFLKRILKNNKPFDLVKAQWYCDLHRNDIKKGILHYELYN